jgi:hypothetical protein
MYMLDGVLKKIKTDQGPLLYVLFGVAIILTILVIFLALKVSSVPAFTIPSHITGSLQYQIYAPSKLPSGYKVNASSFMTAEGTLIFQAEDGSGSSIHFSQQQKPQDFDFDRFYREEMENAKRLEKAPHQSYIGKSGSAQRNLLSVVIDNTWVLISTNATFSEQDYINIAKGLKRY